MARIVTTWASKGGAKKIESDAKTWGELKSQLSGHYNLSNLQGTESVSKVSYTDDRAALPEGDFTIFFKPVKVKSGSVDYANLSYREYRELMKTNSELKKFMDGAITDGRNWTQYKTEEFRKFVPIFFESLSNSNGAEHQEKVEEAQTPTSPSEPTGSNVPQDDNNEGTHQTNDVKKSYSIIVVGYIASIMTTQEFATKYGMEVPFVKESSLTIEEANNKTSELNSLGLITFINDDSVNSSQTVIEDLLYAEEETKPLLKITVVEEAIEILKEFVDEDDERVDYIIEDLTALISDIKESDLHSKLLEEESSLSVAVSESSNVSNENRETESERIAREEREFQQEMEREANNFFRG